VAHIDWIKCVVPMLHKKHIHGGVRARFEDSCDYKLDYQILETTRLEGSGSSSVSLRTVDAWNFFEPKEGETVGETLIRHWGFLPEGFSIPMLQGKGRSEEYENAFFFLQIEGNIGKYFQGQSIYCPMNANGLIVDFIHDVCRTFGIEPTAHDLKMWRQGFFYPQRLDICENRRLNNYKDADAFIHGVVKSASLNGRGFRFDHNEKQEGFTAVHATSGRLCRFSVYNKYCDLRDNKYGKPKFEDEDLNKRILDHADGLVRFEAKYKSSWFRRNGIETFYELWKHYPDLSSMLFDKINGMKFGGTNMKDTVMEDLKSELPTHILPTYLFWLDGKTVVQIKEMLGGGRRTSSGDRRYQRASKYLREEHHVNVKVRLTNAAIEKKHVSNVIPMVRVLEAKPDVAPQWFYDEGLIYEPSKHALYAVK